MLKLCGARYCSCRNSVFFPGYPQIHGTTVNSGCVGWGVCDHECNRMEIVKMKSHGLQSFGNVFMENCPLTFYSL